MGGGKTSSPEARFEGWEEGCDGVAAEREGMVGSLALRFSAHLFFNVFFWLVLVYKCPTPPGVVLPTNPRSKKSFVRKNSGTLEGKSGLHKD